MSEKQERRRRWMAQIERGKKLQDWQRHRAYEWWLSTRPRRVARILKRFPAWSKVHDSKGPWYVIGATESGMLIMSRIDPAVDFDGAMAEKSYVHAYHVKTRLASA